MIRLLAVLLTLATPVFAHGLNVFASVDGADLVIEAKFSSGRMPSQGEVRIFDGSETLLGTVAITEAGPIRLPRAEFPSETGLLIEVETGEGHSDYWILTPEDLATPTN